MNGVRTWAPDPRPPGRAVDPEKEEFRNLYIDLSPAHNARAELLAKFIREPGQRLLGKSPPILN